MLRVDVGEVWNRLICEGCGRTLACLKKGCTYFIVVMKCPYCKHINHRREGKRSELKSLRD